MKIKYKYPPNYKEIVERFPAVKRMPGVVVTYENVLYVPSGSNIPPDLMVHEETHMKQQNDMGVKEWWKHYFLYDEFRLKQEVEAYHNQFKYAKLHYGRQQSRKILRKIAKDLSCPMYGNIISKDKAKELIKAGINE